MESSVMPGFHVMSDLLTIKEKNVIYNLIQPPWTLMKSTVAQVLESTEERGAPAWRSAACGVLCVVRDDLENTYFLRLFCVQRAQLLWEQEVYVPFKYTASCTYFHTFPADGRQAGFNFADEAEAEEFCFAVEHIREHLASLSFQDMTERSSLSKDDNNTSAKSSQPVNTERRISCPEVSPTSSPSAFDVLKDSELEKLLWRLFHQSHLTEEDLKSRSVTEIVDHIIVHFGGPQAIQRELYARGSGAMTVSPSSSSSLAPLPQTPAFTERTTDVHYSLLNCAAGHPSLKSSSFTVPLIGNTIITALTDVCRKKGLQQRDENEFFKTN